MVHFVCILILLIKKTIILSIKYPQYTKAWNSPFAKSESLILWVSSSRHCIAWMDLSSFIVLRMSILLPLKVCLPGWPCRSGAVLQIHPSSSVSIKSKLEGSQILGSCNPAGNRQMLWRYDPTKNKQKKAPKIYKCNLWVHSIALYPLAVFVFVGFFAVILNWIPNPRSSDTETRGRTAYSVCTGCLCVSSSISSPPWSPRDIYDSYISPCCSLSTAFQIHDLKQSSVTFIIRHKWIDFTFHSVLMLL